jgi:two-component system, NtrC family, nitrogen regulation sensor histidine kinase NtrY
VIPRRRFATLVAWVAGGILPLAAATAILAVAPATARADRIVLALCGCACSGTVGWAGIRRVMASADAVADLLGALREGDYGMRGRVGPARDALGIIAGVNHLSDDLRESRRLRTEASRFLGKTLVALHSPVVVVDGQGLVRLINPAARALAGIERAPAVGLPPAALGLAPLMASTDGGILSHAFPGATGRWAVRRATWHSAGRSHTLVMLHDLHTALNEEEHRAWQRLIRVLSHELNNSLAPIESLADTLSVMLERHGMGMPEDDLRVGLDAIARRSAALSRFVGGYGRLARMPPIDPRPFRLDALLARIVPLEHRVPVVLRHGGAVTVDGDEGQLELAFTNLLRNAADAVEHADGGVQVGWQVNGRHVTVRIVDDGIGLPKTDSLFVPFFTTKAEGSGIGLSLVRLVVEAHGGTVTLADRADRPGAVATVRLATS